MQDGPPIRRDRNTASGLSLLVLPGVYAAAALWSRAAGGPAWLWFNLDPAYFYLLDALNLINLTAPAIVYHPGIPVTWLGALVLKAAHPLAGADALTGMVLADPEFHLRLIGGVFVALNALALLAVGVAGRRACRSLTAAWFLQSAPFLSMVILKHSYHVKPEALLLATTLLLIAAAMLTLEPGLVERHRRRFAVGFGVIAGFGVAVKITAFPVFVLPLFVVGGPRWMIVYGASALASLVVFMLPAAGAADVFVAWMTKVALGTGAYGGGPAGFVDWTQYPASVLKLFKRPVFHVPFVLAALTLAWAWRRRRERPLDVPALRLLAGVVAAQLAQALIVAKQPNAMYMIPSLVLSAPAVVVLWRLLAPAVAGRAAGRADGPRWLGRGFAVLLAAVLAAGAFGTVRLAGELAADAKPALAADNDRFRACARVYAYAASSPSFALLLGDYVAGGRFGEQLSQVIPANDFWLEHWWDQSRVAFRDARGPADMAAALGRYPCVMVRGSHWFVTGPLLKKMAPAQTFDAACSTRDEIIHVRGAGCDGKPRP
ncbi:MAG TPA: hypothetical protein VGA19_01265 [Rhodospirillales bacterium]